MSNSLGVLTLDILLKSAGFVEGWDAATRETKKRKKELTKELKELGDDFVKYGSAAVVAVAAATAAVVAHTVSSSREISRLSALSAAGTDEFQRYAAGSKQVGVEQAKLADIFKDTNEKIGDFMQTGAGPLSEFFNTIAPKVGVTTEAFKGLSGPQALQLYASTLEKANVSQQQMTFFMNKINADAVKLTPLLRDGAAGFKLFADEAQRAGVILDEKTISSADKIAASLLIAKNASQGFKNQIATGLLPTIVDLSGAFVDISIESTVAASTSEILAGSLKFVAASAVGTVAAIDLTRKALAGFVALLSSMDFKWSDALFGPLGITKVIIQSGKEITATSAIVSEDISKTQQAYATLLNSIWSAGDGKEGQMKKRVDAIAAMFKELRAVSSAGGTDDPNTKLQDDMDKRLEILRQASMSELELIQQRNTQEFQLLLEANDAKRISDEEHKRLQKASDDRASEARILLAKKEADLKKSTWVSSLSIISTLMNSESKKMFRIGQAAAIANTIISTREGMMKALAQLGAWGWPVATAIGLAGAASIAQIANTKIGGGSSAGLSTTQAVNATTTPVNPVGSPSSQPQQRVIVEGLTMDSLLTGRMVMDLFNAAVADGARPIFT